MKKSTTVRITEDQVPERFNDDFIAYWAIELKIPVSQRSEFGTAVREAARLYSHEYLLFDQKNLEQIRQEIRDLSNAAEARSDSVAILRENLSERARDLLSLRGSLPSADDLRGPQREAACAIVARLCRNGGRAGRIVSKSEYEIDLGRGPVRVTKIERNFQPDLWAPPPSSRHFPKLWAERCLVSRLHAAVSKAWGRPAGKWANPSDPSPFVRFVQEVLKRVGYPYKNVAQIINELAKKVAAKETADEEAGVQALNAEGLGAPEIAERLGIEVHAVEQILERVRSPKYVRVLGVIDDE